MKNHFFALLFQKPQRMRQGRLCILLWILLFIPQIMNAQQKEVTGVVTMIDREPIIGAAVFVKETKAGVITDADGNFKIKAAGNHTLVISYVGMITQELPVQGRYVINIVMKEKSVDLDEVVVVGYGTMKKRDITGAITSVTGEDIESRMTTGVLEALQGQMPGMEIVAGSGQPGESSTVRVRGTATFSDGAASPLYIVDGVPMDDINTINPMDIASVELLKDAASASIYGSRSANGVILVTTKQGDNLKPVVNIRYLHSWSTLSHKMEMVTPQLRRYFSRQRLAYSEGDGAGYVPVSFLNHDRALLNDTTNYMFNANNDYQKLAFNTAERNQVDASFGGGTNNLKYNLSAGYLDESGIIPSTGYSRLTTRLNADYHAFSNLKLLSKISFTYGQKEGIDESDYLNSLIRRLPNLSLTFPDETLAGRIWGVNPLGYGYATNKKDEYRATLFQSGELQIMKGLKFIANVSASYAHDKYKKMTPSFLINENQTSNNASSIGSMSWNWMNEDYFTYELKWKNKHTLNALLGYSMQEWHSESDRIFGKDSPTDYIYTMNAYVANLDLNQTGTTESEHAMMSFFSRVTYNYLSKYIISANIRSDGSSRFSKDSRWGYFPSVSAAWRFSDENFLKWSNPALTDGKLRLSYGITGNESIGDYDYLMTYGIGGVYDNISTITPASLGMNGLKWEETAQFNLGLDLILFDRVNLVIDYYDKQTKNLLANHQLPKEIGFSSIRRNIGEISNRGLEVAVSGDIIKSKDFRWNMAFNIATNINKVKKLSEGKPYLLNSTWWIQEGGKIGDFYGYENLGIFQYDQSNAFTGTWQQLTPVFESGVFQDRYLLDGKEYAGTVNRKKLPSGEVFRGGDVNWAESGTPDGVINENDRKVVGNAQPEVYGGLNSTFTYKGLTLSVAFNYSFGGTLYNQAMFGANTGSNPAISPTRDYIQNMWIKQGDIAKYPRPVADIFQNSREVDSHYLEDASYIRLKNVRLGYKLPKKILKGIGIRNVEVYAYGTNLLLWTAYSGFDPEISTGSALSIGLDTNRYPKKREFGIGTSVNF